MDSLLNASPEGLVILGVAAATIGYLVKSWEVSGAPRYGPQQVDAITTTVPVDGAPDAAAIVPPSIHREPDASNNDHPVVVGAGSNEDTLVDDNAAQLLVDPVMDIVVPIVSYVTAMQCLTSLLVSIPEVVTMGFNDPLTRATKRIRVKFGCLRDSAGWLAGAPAKLNEIRAKAAGHGIVKKSDVGFDQGEMALFAFRRMMLKIWQPIDVANDRRWMDRMVLSGTVRICSENVTMWTPARGGDGATYPVYQWRGMRSDAGWTLMYFLIIRGLMLSRGATNVQSEYVACSAVIELVGVAYGQPENINWGYDAADFGFAVPNDLPTY